MTCGLVVHGYQSQRVLGLGHTPQVAHHNFWKVLGGLEYIRWMTTRMDIFFLGRPPVC
jgi:hypothetical protein